MLCEVLLLSYLSPHPSMCPCCCLLLQCCVLPSTPFSTSSPPHLPCCGGCLLLLLQFCGRPLPPSLPPPPPTHLLRRRLPAAAAMLCEARVVGGEDDVRTHRHTTKCKGQGLTNCRGSRQRRQFGGMWGQSGGQRGIQCKVRRGLTQLLGRRYVHKHTRGSEGH